MPEMKTLNGTDRSFDNIKEKISELEATAIDTTRNETQTEKIPKMYGSCFFCYT